MKMTFGETPVRQGRAGEREEQDHAYSAADYRNGAFDGERRGGRASARRSSRATISDVSIVANDKAEADRVFQALSGDGGRSRCRSRTRLGGRTSACARPLRHAVDGEPADAGVSPNLFRDSIATKNGMRDRCATLTGPWGRCPARRPWRSAGHNIGARSSVRWRGRQSGRPTRRDGTYACRSAVRSRRRTR